MFCFSNVFWEYHGVYSEYKWLRESHTRMSLNHQWHNGLWKMVKIFLQLQESLKWIKNALESGLNKKKVWWIKNVGVDQMAEVVLRGFDWWNSHCTVIIKRHGMEGKQSNVGGLTVEKSSSLKNFIQMNILKLWSMVFEIYQPFWNFTS